MLVIYCYTELIHLSTTETPKLIWSPWSACPVTCGSASVVRTRACPSGKKCQANELVERQACQADTACPGTDYFYITYLCVIMYAVASNWQPWLTWSACSVSCDYGLKSRSRTCDKKSSIDYDCKGITEMTAACKLEHCTGSDPKLQLQHIHT